MSYVQHHYYVHVLCTAVSNCLSPGTGPHHFLLPPFALRPPPPGQPPGPHRHHPHFRRPLPQTQPDDPRWPAGRFRKIFGKRFRMCKCQFYEGFSHIHRFRKIFGKSSGRARGCQWRGCWEELWESGAGGVLWGDPGPAAGVLNRWAGKWRGRALLAEVRHECGQVDPKVKVCWTNVGNCSGASFRAVASETTWNLPENQFFAKSVLA